MTSPSLTFFIFVIFFLFLSVANVNKVTLLMSARDLTFSLHTAGLEGQPLGWRPGPILYTHAHKHKLAIH